MAVAGTVACRVALIVGPFAHAAWLQIVAAGFEAAVVGGLADWFAVTALFRHPLGVPIPHTAIIPARRKKIVESIVSMIQDEWLSPDVIGARLARFAPSELVVDWLRDPEHVERLGGPLRDLLRGLARMLGEAEVAEFVDRAIQHQLRDLPIDASAGRVAGRMPRPARAPRPRSTPSHSRSPIWRSGRGPCISSTGGWSVRLARCAPRATPGPAVPAPQDRPEEDHRGRVWVRVGGAAERGPRPPPPAPQGRVRRAAELRRALGCGRFDGARAGRTAPPGDLESLEANPLVREVLARLREQLEHDLEQPGGYLSELVDRKLRAGISSCSTIRSTAPRSTSGCERPPTTCYAATTTRSV